MSGASRWNRVFVAAALAWVAAQALAAFTESVNWDEFALLHRVEAFVRTGQLQGGGRPGLVELVLAPFVEGCRDAVSALRQARLLWLGITAAYLAAAFVLVRRLLRSLASPTHAAWLGVALLALVPVFQRWSLQVRTDQPAQMLALWGAVALLFSRTRLPLAFAGGLLVGLGALFSQKAVYLGALGGLLTLADLWINRPADVRGELRRLAGRVMAAGLGAALAWVSYRAVLPLFVELPRYQMTVGGGLDVFAHYRRMFGYRAYQAMLPTLLPHLVLGVLLVVATVRRAGSDTARRALHAAWAVLALGLAVGLFHAGAFPYFWITLGLFPALAAGLASEAIAASLPRADLRRAVFAGCAGLLALQASVTVVQMLGDTQAVQRASLGFIERGFSPTARGFHAEGALACRQDPQPFPIYFTENIIRAFGGENAQQNIEKLKQEFRSRPVEFLVGTHVFHQFPLELRQFWFDRYVLYEAQVYVPGRFVDVPPGGRATFDVLVPGRYRWELIDGGASTRLHVGDRTLAPGEVVELDAGEHALIRTGAPGAGLLVRAIDEPPQPAGEGFYSERQIAEIVGE